MSKQKRKNVNPLTEKAQRKVMQAYYKRHLDLFVEEYLGVKLYWFQRFILKNVRLK